MDAVALYAAGRLTGAVYLSGYAVECAVKAQVISVTPPAGRGELIQSFRGNRAHDYLWLRNLYRDRGGRVPREVAVLYGSRELIAGSRRRTQSLQRTSPGSQFPGPVLFTAVGSWSVDLRYNPGVIAEDEAARFIPAAAAIISWVRGRA